MAYSYIEYTSNSSANSGKDYTYSFSAVAHDTTNIKVTVGGSALSSSNYSVVQGTVTLSAVPGAGSSPLNAALSSTNVLRIYRQTNRTAAEVVFSANSVIQDEDLNTATDQARFLALEAIDRTNESIAIDPNDTTQYNIEVDGVDKRISGVATPTGDDDAVNKAYSDANVLITEGYKNNADTYRNDALDHRDTAEDYATRTAGTVRHFDGATNNTSDSSPSAQSGVYSSKAWAIGGTGVTDTASRGASKEWAIETSSSVDTSEYSAKEYAVGTQRRGQANGGSAKDWATYTSGTVDNSGYSALYHANAAENSAIAAKNSAAAVANVYDNFADTFLGSMADGASASSGSANGTWAKNSSSITLASTSGTIEVGQEVTGSGIPTDANVLSVDGSTIVISENMNAAGSSVSLTFTGQGIYGAFNSSKDGPATDNDGDALATGALYFNTTDNAMRIYDGANWIAASASGSTSFLVYKYVATGGQTTFTGNDANGATLSYTTNNIIVFLNGVKLDASDFTATSGTSVVLGSGATASDELVVVAFKSFTTADMVPASTGGTFSGNVVFSGNTTGLDVNGTELVLDADGDTSITADTDDQIDVKIGGTDKARIDSSGIRLLGTDADTSSQVLFNDTGGQEWGIQYDAGALKFSESGVATQVTMSDGGDVTVNTGNLVIGTAGKGIDFSNATDQATGETTTGSLLDDYEEGSFSPKLNGVTGTTVNGYYRKVGNMVNVSFSFDHTALTNTNVGSSTHAYVSDLPFVSANKTGYCCKFWLDWYFADGTSLFTVSGHMSANQDKFYLYCIDSATTDQTAGSKKVTGSIIGTDSSGVRCLVRGSATYHTD